MPNYKLKEGKLVRRNAKGEKQSFTAGDVVEMTPEQAKKYGLGLLERQNEEDAKESKSEGSKKAAEPKLTTNPEGGKQAANKKA